jgi:adenylate kinase
LPQAQSFQQLLHEEGLSLDSVVNYELPMPEIIARLSGRRVCAKCKVVFHQTQSPPKLEGICDRCGGALVQREDDRAESVKVRLEAYTRETAPLIGFYRDAGLLLSVNAAGTPKEVFARSIASLEAAVTDGTLRSRNPWDSISGLGGGEMNHGSYKERL